MVKLVRLRNYEKKLGLFIVVGLFLILVLFSVIMAFLYKINSYFLITGVVAKDALVEAVVSDSELQILYKNSILYVDDVRYKYSINEVMLGAIKRNNTVYNLVYISFPTKKMKENDVVDLVFLDRKIGFMEIFKLVWKEIL